MSEPFNSSQPGYQQPHAPPPIGRALPWYEQAHWLAIWLLVFWPVAAYGLAKTSLVSRKWKLAIVAGVIFLVLALVAFAVGIWVLVMSMLRSTWAFAEGMELARENPALIREIGEPIEPGWWMAGSIQTTGASGDADLSIPISGPNGEGTLYLIATKTAGQWEWDRAEVEIDGRPTRIDLLRAPN